MQFIDLAAQQVHIRDRIDAAIAGVLDRGEYIMGPEVKALETLLTDFCGAKHCITCANGTDAIQLALMALNVGVGDAIFVPSFTFAATAEVVPGLGATPVFVDIDPITYNMDPTSLVRAITHAKTLGLRPAVVIPVDLFGLPAEYPTISIIARSEGMKIIGDSAQGFGGLINGQMTGNFGDITTTSFFPAKPLGCYGDGGALFTDDDNLAVLLDSLRVHGKGREKYENVRIGMNSRLDTLQAAVLIEKLAVYEVEIAARQRVAEKYTAALHNQIDTPYVPEGYSSIWAQYTLRARDTSTRDTIMAFLKAGGIPSVIYYPRPLHTQEAYKDFPFDPAGLLKSEAAAQTVFSLPMYPYLESTEQAQIITTCLASFSS